MALSLGTIYGTLELEDKFSKGLQDSTKNTLAQMGSLGSAITGVAAAFVLAQKGVTFFADAIGGTIAEVAQLASKAESLQNKSLTTGLTTGAVQSLQRLSENAGLSADALTFAVGRMQRVLVGGGDAFKKIGLDAKELLKLGTNDQLKAVADRIMAIENPAQRTAAAMEVFGRSGRELLPVLKELAEGNEALKVSLSEEQITNLAKLDDAIDDMSGAWKDLQEQFLATIGSSPEIVDALKGITGMITSMIEPVGILASGIGMLTKKLAELAATPRNIAEVLGLAELGAGPKLSAVTSKSAGAFGKAAAPSAGMPSAEEALSIMNLDDLKKGKESIEAQVKAIKEATKATEDQAAALLKVEVAYTAIQAETDAAFATAGVETFNQKVEEQIALILKTGEAAKAVLAVDVERTRLAAETDAAFAEAGIATALDKAAASGRKFAEIMGSVVALGGLIGGSIGAALTGSAQSFSNYRDEIAKANALTDKGEQSQAKFAAKIGLASAAAGMLGDALQKNTNPTVAKLGGALSGAAAGAKMGAAFGPYGAAIGAVGGAIMGFINKAKAMKKELKDIKDKFAESMGGMDELKRKALEAGVSLDKMFAAKNKEALLKSIDEVKGKLQTWDDAHTKLQAAIDKYGITVEELGPKFAQQEMDKKAGTLIEAWSLLAAAGVDVGVLVAKMGPDMSAFVDQSVRAGTAIPEAMRASIDALYEAGQLIHDDGTAFTEAEYKALSFSQTMTEQFETLIQKITEMVNALMGIPSDVSTNVNVNTNYTSSGQQDQSWKQGGAGQYDQAFATGGVVTSPRIGLVGEGGPEAIIPLSEMGGMGGPTTAELSSNAVRGIIRGVRDALLQAQ